MDVVTSAAYYADLLTLLYRLERTPEAHMPLGGVLRLLVSRLREETMERLASVASGLEEVDETLARARQLEVDDK